MITFYEYPKCTTCRKGKKFLTENDLDFTVIDMVKHVPSRDTLKGILDKSSHSIDDFFNTRGTKFKDLGLKEKLPELSEEEKLEYLSSDGMLIKRPIVVLDDEVLLGFKEETYKNTLLK
ncbi:Regulatory protein MgsR [Jeotgalicoccus aerolatus]|uniref:Arsenate reductase n=1 Tax=Jeotgalicoccus aerolatus TaxID=709510 RepID=A0ABS4HJT7_9STAP|nr:Spx/MgsR family RNA polymerase-binding regulatory protein [Jeotgalicoccus aerolatus]MBP1951186.1 arsenate reductase [Jeotgalicoccus aerolatus]GGD99552.1 arsenate reductase [Jeotgalicoccus aerolatus]CAD2077708.1 Regulatory protein MgsR [Jeotgalicoccus aerolatus]HJG33093.1 Spx/MgsR family RNA polymerase-binding regulatory protein [Jeotgalicoccus aerolatus]